MVKLDRPPGVSLVPGQGEPDANVRCRARQQADVPKNVQAIEYDMQGFLQQCIDRYVELAGPSGLNFRYVDTPFVDEAPLVPESETDVRGALAPIASKVLMKILYAARMARFDLLGATCYLATLVTKWTPTCDKMLRRLVC